MGGSTDINGGTLVYVHSPIFCEVEEPSLSFSGSSSSSKPKNGEEEYSRVLTCVGHVMNCEELLRKDFVLNMTVTTTQEEKWLRHNSTLWHCV